METEGKDGKGRKMVKESSRSEIGGSKKMRSQQD